MAAFGRSQIVVRVDAAVRKGGTTELMMTVHSSGAQTGDLCALELELRSPRAVT